MKGSVILAESRILATIFLRFSTDANSERKPLKNSSASLPNGCEESRLESERTSVTNSVVMLALSPSAGALLAFFSLLRRLASAMAFCASSLSVSKSDLSVATSSEVRAGEGRPLGC